MSYTAPPWEVVIPEETDSAVGRFYIIRAADVTIAAVYPTPQNVRQAKANADLMGAAPYLLDRLKVARAFIEDSFDVLERSYSPVPSAEESEELGECRELLNGIDAAIYHASPGRALEPATEPQNPTEAKQKEYPEIDLESRT